MGAGSTRRRSPRRQRPSARRCARRQPRQSKRPGRRTRGAVRAAGRPAGGSAGGSKPARRPWRKGERIRVQTDYLIAEIDTLGGDLRHVEFTPAQGARGQEQELRPARGESAARVCRAQRPHRGRASPTTTRCFRRARPPIELASERGDLVVRLEGPATASAQGGEDLHVPSRAVTSSMWDSRSPTSAATPSEPYAYFQLVRDTKPARGRLQVGPDVHRRRGLHREGQAAQGRLRRHRGEQGHLSKERDGRLARLRTALLPERLAAPAGHAQRLFPQAADHWPGGRRRDHAGRYRSNRSRRRRSMPSSTPARRSRSA